MKNMESTLNQRTQEPDILEDAKLFQYRIEDIKSRMKYWESMQNDYIKFCQDKNLYTDAIGLEVSNSVKNIMLNILPEFDLERPGDGSIEEYSSYITRQNFRIRNLLLLLGQFCSHLEWSSASYNQAIVPNFFDLRKQSGKIVNYDRWESFLIADMENELTKLYDLNSNWSLLLASSGMAAYAIINNFITRHLSGDDKIIIPVPVYHEAEALLSAIPGVQILRLNTTDTDEIVSSIDRETKAVFLTPITNDEFLRFLDIDSIIQKISLRNLEIFIVVDGTMSGGLIRPEKIVNGDTASTLLYFESGNKYQQFEDTAMKGIVIVPQSLREKFVSIRRELGTILYDRVAVSLPYSISSEEFKLKMIRFARNASYISNQINTNPDLPSFCRINYPLNPGHPDYNVAHKYSADKLGGVVTISFYESDFYQKDILDYFIENLIQKCQKRSIPFCKGDSYGFSIPRMHIGGSRSCKPFLRLCAGNRSIGEVKVFALCLVESLRECQDKKMMAHR
ncbi:MAG: PLP-dependent transferase [Moorea sp. SIO2I5]|nr:PLP-dependent transferase [Moorena sp. SIO2I5]